MNDIVISVLDAFKILEAADLLNESEARDLTHFAQSKTCDTLCKVLNKTARLEVEGGANADNDGYRIVCVGKAEALFEFADHLQRLREAYSLTGIPAYAYGSDSTAGASRTTSG